MFAQVMRHSDPLDSPTSRHCNLLHKLSEISHPNLLRVLMVYPVIYERVVERQGILGGASVALPQITGIPPKQGRFRSVPVPYER